MATIERMTTYGVQEVVVKNGPAARWSMRTVRS